MLIDFFFTLRRYGINATIRELLDLLAVLESRLVFASIDDFYFLARTCLVKDEALFDKYDRAFAAYFKDLETLDGLMDALIPDEWLRKEFEKQLTEEEKQQIESLGGLEKLIEEFKKRLEEQNEKHEGGNKWIGTGGTSPFGQNGYNPEGIRVGSEGSQKKAVKVWDKREYKNLDDSVQLGTRNIKVALKRLRKFARTGTTDELDLPDTIRSTAHNGGLLDIKMVPERHNAVKVLVFFDVGGSMDPHIKVCEELFSAARSEFKHLEYFYFHNFIYDTVWKNNYRRHSEHIDVAELLRKYPKDYKVIFIGDASMSPYEIFSVGGSVEYWNQESGEVWMQRVKSTWDKVLWLNPVPKEQWGYTQSIELIHQLMEGHMQPLTIKGIEEGMRWLSK